MVSAPQYKELEEHLVAKLTESQINVFTKLQSQLCEGLDKILSDHLERVLPKACSTPPRESDFNSGRSKVSRKKQEDSNGHRTSPRTDGKNVTWDDVEESRFSNGGLRSIVPEIVADKACWLHSLSHGIAKSNRPFQPKVFFPPDDALASVTARGGVSRRQVIEDASGPQNFPRLLGCSVHSEHFSLQALEIEVSELSLEVDATKCDHEGVDGNHCAEPCSSIERNLYVDESPCESSDGSIHQHTDLDALFDLSDADRNLHSNSINSGGRSEIRRLGKIALVDCNQSTIAASAASIVKSSFYGYFVCAMLLVNALTIGLEVNCAAANQNQTGPVAFRISEVCFCILFTLEVALRIFVQRRAFFQMPALPWNAFDLCLVGLQLLELLMTAVMTISDGDGDGIFLASKRDSGWVVKLARGLQLLRIIRVLRIVHIVRDLNTLVYLICASMWSFLWTVALLALLTYIVGVFITQLVVEQHWEDAASVAPGTELHRHFGSIFRSFLSLYQAISGGVDWANLVEPLASTISPAIVPLVALYVAFAVLVLLNLVTGVYVEGAQRLTKDDRERELLRKARKIFIQTDSDDTSTITWGEFRSQLDGSLMKDLLSHMDLGLCKPEDVFWLLDREGEGQIKAEQFVQGTFLLGRPARTIDVALIQREIQELSIWIRHNFTALQKRLSHDDESGSRDGSSMHVSEFGFPRSFRSVLTPVVDPALLPKTQLLRQSAVSTGSYEHD